MPELPEVECVVRALRKCIKGKRIINVKFFFTRMLQGVDETEFASLIQGREIEEVRRQGKYILFFLSGETILEVHLRMTGRFLFAETDIPSGPHTGAVFYFEDGGFLHYQDLRKLGTFRTWSKELLQRSPACRLGPDPLDQSYTLACFLKLLEKKRPVRIKSLLLNQLNLAGLGNIYTDEALYRARIHPCRTAGSLASSEKEQLYKSIRSVLQESIACGGTTFSDFRDLQGRTGYYQQNLKVYRRKNEKCQRCGAPIERMVVSGRGTYYCPVCQH